MSESSIKVTACRRLKCRRIVYSSESEDEAQNITDNLPDQWINLSKNQLSLILFMSTPGITLLDYLWKEDFYLLLVTEEMFQDIVE